MPHPFTHIEFSAKDRQESARFFSSVFGWEITEYPEMNYTTLSSGEAQVSAGLSPISAETPAGTVLVYIETGDLEATLKKIAANGGVVTQGKSEIPGVGYMAVFTDPSGNQLALLQPEAMD